MTCMKDIITECSGVFCCFLYACIEDNVVFVPHPEVSLYPFLKKKQNTLLINFASLVMFRRLIPFEFT